MMQHENNVVYFSPEAARILGRSRGIEVDEFETRILIACMTDRALSDHHDQFRGLRPLRQPIWREAMKEWSEYGSEESNWEFKPSREQIGDWEKVMPWCATLDKKDFRIISSRARIFLH
jgi:hypothetical protein